MWAMSAQTRLNNAFAIRSFLTLVGGVVLLQVGQAMGHSPSHTLNWYFIASCVIYALMPITLLRSILRAPHFPRRSYAMALCVAALLALALGLAFAIRLL